MNHTNSQKDPNFEEKVKDTLSSAGQSTGEAIHKAGDKLEDVGDALQQSSEQLDQNEEEVATSSSDA